MRKLISAVVVFGITAGLAWGQNPAAQPGGVKGKDQAIWGKIVKVDGNKITVQEFDRNTKKFGKDRELTAAPDKIKVFQMGKDNKPLAVDGGLKAKLFQNLDKEGTYANIRVQGDSVAEIRVFPDMNSFMQSLQGSAGATGTGATDGRVSRNG
jgi:hypothetical protein